MILSFFADALCYFVVIVNIFTEFILILRNYASYPYDVLLISHMFIVTQITYEVVGSIFSKVVDDINS